MCFEERTCDAVALRLAIELGPLKAAGFWLSFACRVFFNGIPSSQDYGWLKSADKLPETGVCILSND